MKVRKSSWPMIWTNSFHEDVSNSMTVTGFPLMPNTTCMKSLKSLSSINTFEDEEDVFVQELDRGP